MKATANYSAKTFTIRLSYAKYRTFKMSNQDFQSCLHNTENDWKQYLATEDDYYIVKK